jgi:hypothetical protein
MRTLPRLILFLLAVPGLLAACAQPAFKDQACAGFEAQDLYTVRNSGFAEACARRDAALSSYRAVDIEPLGVSRIDIPRTNVMGTRRRDWAMTAERQSALQAAWADAMDQAFASYARATGEPGVLRIAAELTRIAPGRPSATTIGGALQPVGSTEDVVEIWAEFRLYDGADGRLLAVTRDSRTITSVQLSRTAPATIRLLFGSWAALLHTRVTGR